MSQYLNSIKDILNNLISTIDKYSSYDSNAILPKITIEEIKKEIENIEKSSIKLTNNLNKSTNSLIKEANSNKKRFHQAVLEKEKEIKELEDLEKINISKSEIEKDQRIKLLNEKLEHDKKEAIKQIEENKNSSKETNKYFLNDYRETEKRLAFKNQSSKDYYNNCIKKYNNRLENELKNIDKAYSRLYINYDNDTKALITKYNRLIEDYNNQYKKLQKDKLDYITALNIESKESTINLNNEIRPLFDTKNKNIEERRAIYSKEQNTSNIEKENKRHDLHNESNRITKEFIVNVKAIDSKIEEYKKEYENNRESKINTTLYTILEDHKRLQFEVSELINQNDSLETKKLITLKYKLFSKRKEKLEAKLDNELRILEVSFLKTLESEFLEKKRLEFEKNTIIKKLIEEENTLVKQYQEFNNKYEANLRYDEGKYKITYDINSSSIKHSHNIEQIKKKREKNIRLAEFDIELQKISYKIKMTEANLEITKELNSLIHEYEDKVYQKKKSFNTVFTMLEIERHKTLSEYNDNLYKLKLNEAKEEFRFNGNLSDLKNKIFEKDINNELEINEKYVDIEILSHNNEHDKNKLNSEIVIMNTKRKNFSYLEEYKLLLQNELFNLDFKHVQIETTNYYLFLKLMCSSIFSIIEIVDKSIEAKKEIITELRNFFISLEICIIDYVKSIMKCYKDNIKAIIEDNRKNLENLYFNQKREKLKLKYDNDIIIQKNNIISNKNKADLLSDDNTEHNKKLYALKSKYNKTKSILERWHIQKDINAITNIINRNDRKIKNYKTNIQKIQKEIEKIKNNYLYAKNRINKTIDKELKSYKTLLEDIIEINSNLLTNINSVLNEPYDSTDYVDYFSNLETKISNVINNLDKSLSSIYNVINDFKLKRYLELEKKNITLKKNLRHNEHATSIEIREKEYNFDKKYKELFRNCKNEINNCKKNNLISKMKSKEEIQNLRNEHDKATKILQQENKNLGANLYLSLYAVLENIKSIELDYHMSIGDCKNKIYQKSFKDELKEKENILTIKTNDIKKLEEKRLYLYEENKKSDIRGYITQEAQGIKQEILDYHNLKEKYKNQNTENYTSYKTNISDAEMTIAFNKKNLNKSIKSLDNELRLLIKAENKKHKIQLKKIDKSVRKKKYFTS